MVDFMEANKKINELAQTGLYNSEQLEVIKYAMFREAFDSSVLMDSSISAEDMKIYINLHARGVPVEKYINAKWHKKGYTPQQLFSVIWADNLGVDVSHVTPDVSVEQINEYMSRVLGERHLQELFNEAANVDSEVINQIKNLNVPFVVKRFLTKMAQERDISELLSLGLENYSYEQIKYLNTVLSIGYDVSLISNPALSVDEMKQIMLNSQDHISFVNEIAERVGSRK